MILQMPGTIFFERPKKIALSKENKLSGLLKSYVWPFKLADKVLKQGIRLGSDCGKSQAITDEEMV